MQKSHESLLDKQEIIKKSREERIMMQKELEDKVMLLEKGND